MGKISAVIFAIFCESTCRYPRGKPGTCLKVNNLHPIQLSGVWDNDFVSKIRVFLVISAEPFNRSQNSSVAFALCDHEPFHLAAIAFNLVEQLLRNTSSIIISNV